MTQFRKPIFFDHSGKRWSRILRFAAGLALLFSIVGALFSFSILVLPSSRVELSSTPIAHGRIFVPKLFGREEAARHVLAVRTRDKLIKQISAEKNEKQSANKNSASTYSTVVGFYVNWDPRSFPSLRDHIDSMTYVVPEWLYLDLKSPKLFRDRKDDNKDYMRQFGDVTTLARQHNIPIIPLIHNVVKDGVWEWPRLQALLNDPTAQMKLANNLRDYVKQNDFAGINIDFEPGFPTDKMTPQQLSDAKRTLREGLPKFMTRLNRVFHASHLLVTQDLPVPAKVTGQSMEPDFDYAALNDPNDFVVLMLYDEHSPASRKGNPGTLAAQPWVEDMAQQIFAKMDASKVVLGIANYSADWPVAHDSKGNLQEYILPNGQPSGELAFQGQGKQLKLAAALSAADEAGAPVEMDDTDLNPFFTYVDDKGLDHIVFMLDAVTAYNEVMSLKGYQPRGAALWFVGSEDPNIWSFLSPRKLGKPIKASDMRNVHYTSQVVEESVQGEIKDLYSAEKPGTRDVSFDKDGLIASEDFTTYPSPFMVHHFGNGPEAQNALALTFDDGPDPEFTPQILKVLKDNHVPGTFFVIGKQAERYPNVVKECWDAGCEIGNHTYTHPHILDVSRLRAELEINAAQRTIESIIGHSTKLFRAPYGEGDNITPGNENGQLLQSLQKMGYVVVDMNIDPWDWSRPSVDEIIFKINDQLNAKSNGKVIGQNHVILLHDGGGGRENTILALKKLIPELKKKGYRFVRVSDLLGPKEHEKLFPVVAHSQENFAGLDRVMFEIGFIITSIIEVIFILSIFLGVLRVLLVAPLAIIQARRAKKRKFPDYTPPVAVIIPGYNEDKVICRTIRSVLASDYKHLQVIVIDDGSTDHTAKVVQKAFSKNSRVTFVAKENGGKSSALNLGISMTDAEVIICLDADTIFAKDTISRLVPHFHDPRVGAVAGNVKVGNRTNPLTIWQSVEYITSQNFDRRAYSALNSVSVVPGAVGAWRKSAVIEAGGYDTDTIAEDTDLTFRIRLLGYHVHTENSALAYTEAPDTIQTLAKQRFRWAFGTLQSLWKHRDMLFKKKYGAFSMFVMPATWIYSIFFQAISPIVDLTVLLSLFNAQYRAVLIYYAAFFVLDFFGALLAVELDHEDPKQLIWLFWQRFFYRQFMYYIILKSIVAALRGGIVGWGKFQRKATVTAHEDTPVASVNS